MARPKSADPDATRRRVFDAASTIARVDGVGEVSARTIAKAAGVSASTVCAIAGGMAGVRKELIHRAFRPLLVAFSAALEEQAPRSLFDIALQPLRADPTLPGYVVQVVPWTVHRAAQHGVATAEVDKSWAAVRDVLRTFFIPKLANISGDDADLLADQLLSGYFAAALLLARDPGIGEERLRAIVGLT